MKFSFDVGKNEKHTVSFSFNQMSGFLTVRVDDEKVIKVYDKFLFRSMPPYEINVGNTEKHTVRIENESKTFLQPREYKVFVDGKCLNTYRGY